MDKISIAQAREKESAGREVRLQAWVRTRRDSKAGFSFIELNDGSSMGNIQIVAPAELANYESDVKHLTAGCSVTIEGSVGGVPLASVSKYVDAVGSDARTGNPQSAQAVQSEAATHSRTFRE